MGKFVIEGGRSLAGEITPQGAKNEALQILCATLLTSERIRASWMCFCSSNCSVIWVYRWKSSEARAILFRPGR